MTDLDRYLVSPKPSAVNTGWVYKFPNGHRASLIVDAQRPFRFEVLIFDADTSVQQALAAGPTGLVVGLTSEQVEAKLTEVEALPAVVVNR